MIQCTTQPDRSTFLQALAAGLQLDPSSVAAGRKDGEEGAAFRPLNFDMLAYASGYRDGKKRMALCR